MEEIDRITPVFKDRHIFITGGKLLKKKLKNMKKFKSHY